jgi:hypothetical protein
VPPWLRLILGLGIDRKRATLNGCVHFSYVTFSSRTLMIDYVTSAPQGAWAVAFKECDQASPIDTRQGAVSVTENIPTILIYLGKLCSPGTNAMCRSNINEGKMS